MALRIWLPLNGNLDNKGTSDYEIRSANITIADDGKIGKCYSFNGSNSYINITNFEIGNNWSYGCWVNTPNSDSRGWEIVMILNNSGSDADSQFAFWVHQKENRFESLANTQYVSTIPYTNYYNNWHHFFATFNGTLLTTYIDGNVVNTKTITATQYNAVNLTIGARSTNAAGTSFASWFQGKLNDIRVYDHCLSPLEVKEISQGLVLHYKLDGFSGGAGENILPNTTSEIRSYEYPSSSFKDQFAVITTKIPEAEKYTLSFYAKSTVAGDKIRAHYYSPNTTTTCVSSQGITKTASDGNIDFTLSTDWQLYWVTYTQTSTTAVKRVILPRMGAVGNTNGVVSGTGVVSIKCVKMEEGEQVTPWTPALSEMGIDTTKITDSSGYGNDGIINGNLITNNNTSRYSSSTFFDGNTAAIKIPFNDIIKDKDYTVSCWTYKTTIGTKNYQTILGGPSGFELEARSSSNTNPLYRIHNWGGGTTPYEFNKWNHFCFVHTDADSKLYVNGKLKITGTSANIPTGNYFIGSWSTATSQNYEGQMSDFRLYTTALSAEDILDLYHTPANIDNLGGIHGFEFAEDEGNSISKNGVIHSGNISQFLEMSYLKYDPNIYFEPDGSAWVHIYHHNHPDLASFSSTDTFTASVYKDENRWFNATEICNQLDKWEFLIKYKYETTSTELKERWVQTKNPENAVFGDVDAADIVRNTSTGYRNFTWGGLYKKNGSAYWVLNNGNNGNWWGATGSFSVYQGGIPGYGGTITKTGYNDLYVRIDNVSFNNLSNAKITANNLYMGRDIIEK